MKKRKGFRHLHLELRSNICRKLLNSNIIELSFFSVNASDSIGWFFRFGMEHLILPKNGEPLDHFARNWRLFGGLLFGQSMLCLLSQ